MKISRWLVLPIGLLIAWGAWHALRDSHQATRSRADIELRSDDQGERDQVLGNKKNGAGAVAGQLAHEAPRQRTERVFEARQRIEEALAQPSRERFVAAQRILQSLSYLEQLQTLEPIADSGEWFASEQMAAIAQSCFSVAMYQSEIRMGAPNPRPRPNAAIAAECAEVLASMSADRLRELQSGFMPVPVPKVELDPGIDQQTAAALIALHEQAVSETLADVEPPRTSARLLSTFPEVSSAPERYLSNTADFEALAVASAKRRVVGYAHALAQCEAFGLCLPRSTPARQLCFFPGAYCLPGDDVRTIAARNLPPHELRLAQDLAQGLVREYRNGG